MHSRDNLTLSVRIYSVPIIFQNHPQRNMKRKFNDFLTLLTSNRKTVGIWNSSGIWIYSGIYSVSILFQNHHEVSRRMILKIQNQYRMFFLQENKLFGRRPNVHVIDVKLRNIAWCVNEFNEINKFSWTRCYF